jgi:flagellar motor protein MotB
MKNLLIFLLLLICGFANAQKHSSSPVKQAQKSYNLANQYISYQLFDKAIAELNQAVELDQNFAGAYQQLGDLYRKTGNYNSALKSYHKVLQIDPEFHSLTYYGLAESELNTGDYANAFIHFEKYLKYPGINENSRKKVEKYMNDCLFSQEAIKNPVSFKPVNIGQGINTTENEYLPVITADEGMIIFTRQTNRNEDFYKSIKKDENWSKAEFLSKEINTFNYNEGAQCISPDGNYLFFTGCNRPDGSGRCDIYISRREGNGWSKPFNIGPPVNTPGWESQPSISADGRTLYFVSTRQGGFGGYDIWKTELASNGSWTIPQNLGPEINTEFDEQSPFIHPDDESLYFSSNGWPGFGNKDLFVSRKVFIDGKLKGWKKPENLGYPINTFGEESGLSISSDGRLGFFASNQKDGYGGLDIYSFELPEKVRPASVTYVKGMVFDKDNKEYLDAKIQIVNLKSGELIFDDTVDSETGQFLATMMSDKSFGLNVSKDGYLFYSQNFSPGANLEGKPFIIQVPLQKIEVGGLVVLNNIFFESNKFELLPESKSELLLLVKFLNDNPRIKIEIGGHTDNIGDEPSNQKLSESRAMSVYNFLINNNISKDKLSFKGYGESYPLADNSTEEGRKSNRRTEFKIIDK